MKHKEADLGLNNHSRPRLFIWRAAWVLLWNWMAVFVLSLYPRLNRWSFSLKKLILLCASLHDCVLCEDHANGCWNVCIHTIETLMDMWLQGDSHRDEWHCVISIWDEFQFDHPREIRKSNLKAFVCIEQRGEIIEGKDEETHLVFTDGFFFLGLLKSEDRHHRCYLFKTVLGQRWAQNSQWDHFCVNFSL